MTHPNASSSGNAESPPSETRSALANGATAEQAFTPDEGNQHNLGQAFTRLELARILVAALAAAAVWFRLWEPFPQISVIGLTGLVIGCWPIFAQAFENLLARRMTMELSMAIAIAAAAAISQFFTALIITLFVLVAEVLERMTVSRGRRAIHDLLEFLPRTILVRRASGAAEVEAETVRVGDAVLVNPGGRIPVDGTVVAGHSFAD
jgi:P-type Cu+ transporter